MTTEQKARAYDEALERAKAILKVADNRQESLDYVSTIFPELAEREDEKIKEEIIAVFKGKIPYTSEEDAKRYISWLEEQGKQKHTAWSEEDDKMLEDIVSSISHESVIEGLKCRGIDYSLSTSAHLMENLINWLESLKQRMEVSFDYENANIQQKDFASKVESKFHEGDFIANDYCSGKVIEITNDAYLLDTGQGIPFSCEHNAHLWTIEDAKDGDVLVAHEVIVLFKEIDGLNIRTHFSYHYMNTPMVFTNELHNKMAFRPATKEQRDLLFAKMREAGYEWDAEKKELKRRLSTLTLDPAEVIEWLEDMLHASVGVIDKFKKDFNL